MEAILTLLSHMCDNTTTHTPLTKVSVGFEFLLVMICDSNISCDGSVWGGMSVYICTDMGVGLVCVCVCGNMGVGLVCLYTWIWGRISVCVCVDFAIMSVCVCAGMGIGCVCAYA